MGRASNWITLSCALAACADPASPPAAPARTQKATVAPQSPPATPTSPPSTEAPAPVTPEGSRLAGSRRCALRSQLTLPSAGQLGSLVGRGSEALLLWQTMADGQRALELVRSDGTTLTHELRIPLSQDLARPPVAQLGEGRALDIAIADRQYALSIVQVAHGKVSGARVVARGIDARFAPSLARFSGGLLVAFTKTVEGAMHAFVARVTATKVDVVDVTPVSHGAAACSFVLGSQTPTLVMLDARAGVSPLLEVRFDAQGKAQPAIVRTPVSQPYSPPLLAAVQLANEDTQVAYTAIGRAAATAVGIVALRRAEAPRALLPSLGYGPLAFATALGARAAVFALESKVSAEALAARVLVVKVVDESGEGPSLTLSSADESMSRPVLAAGGPGQFFLLYDAGPRPTLAVLDCDA